MIDPKIINDNRDKLSGFANLVKERKGELAALKVEQEKDWKALKAIRIAKRNRDLLEARLKRNAESVYSILMRKLEETDDFKEAWSRTWPELSKGQIELIMHLPKLDPQVFKDTTGIDITDAYELSRVLV